MARPGNIVHESEIEWSTGGNGEAFVHERKSFTVAAGAQGLGCSLYRLEPGKAAFPAHIHHANEEAIYVLKGEGTLRLGEGVHPVRAGDYIALPPGTDNAHQMRNTSGATLEYLCLSTLRSPEVAEYPDSGKVGVMSGGAPGSAPTARKLLQLFSKDNTVGYFDGE